MAKVSINTPESFAFSTEIDVLIQHINRADHLANENLIALLNEARTRYNASLDFSAANTCSKDFINADLAIIYKSEGHYGDTLVIEVGAQDFNTYGCDYVYKVSKKHNGQLVAIAKTAMLCFDYENKCLKKVPENFNTVFQ